MMTVAKKLVRREACLESGTVESVGEVVEVRLALGLFTARRAKSCLVPPEVGDRVLCAVEHDDVFVLAILEGREGAATRIVSDGDLELAANRGSVAVRAAGGVDVVSAGPVGLTSPELRVRAQEASAAIDSVGLFGRLVRAEVSTLTLVAREVDSVLTRLTQRAKRVFRFVEEIDQTRAGTVDVRAKNLAALRGENTVVSARVLAKIDGEQIHLG